MAPRAKKKCTPTAADRHSTAVKVVTSMGFAKKDIEDTIEALLKVFTKAYGGWDFLELENYSVVVDTLLSQAEPSGNTERGGPSSRVRDRGVKGKGLALRTPLLRRGALPGAALAASGKGKAAMTPVAAKKNMERAIKGKRPVGKPDEDSSSSDEDRSSDEESESPPLIYRRARPHAQGRFVERVEEDVEEMQPCSPPIAKPGCPWKRPAEPNSNTKEQPCSPVTQQRKRPAAEPDMQPRSPVVEQQQSPPRKRRAEPEPEPEQVPEPQQVPEPESAAAAPSNGGMDKNLQTAAAGKDHPAQVGGWMLYSHTPPISHPRQPRIGGPAAASSPHKASTSESGGESLAEYEVKKEFDEVFTAGYPLAPFDLNIKAEPDTISQPVATKAAAVVKNAAPAPLQQVRLEVHSEVKPLASIPAVPLLTRRRNSIFNPDAVVEPEKSIFLRGIPQGASEFGIRELQEVVKKVQASFEYLPASSGQIEDLRLVQQGDDSAAVAFKEEISAATFLDACTAEPQGLSWNGHQFTARRYVIQTSDPVPCIEDFLGELKQKNLDPSTTFLVGNVPPGWRVGEALGKFFADIVRDATEARTSKLVVGVHVKQELPHVFVELESACLADALFYRCGIKNPNLLEKLSNSAFLCRHPRFVPLLGRRSADVLCLQRPAPPNSVSEQENNKVMLYRGVEQSPWGQWTAQIRLPLNGSIVKRSLGSYDTPEEAARAYDKAALHARGPGTITNFSSSGGEGLLPQVEQTTDGALDDCALVEEVETKPSIASVPLPCIGRPAKALPLAPPLPQAGLGAIGSPQDTMLRNWQQLAPQLILQQAGLDSQLGRS